MRERETEYKHKRGKVQELKSARERELGRPAEEKELVVIRL